MSGPFVSNSWVTGDYITQVKMMQHVINEEYLRERTDYQNVYLPFGEKTSIPKYSPGDQALPLVSVVLLFNGSQVGPAYPVSGANGQVDIQDASLLFPTAGHVFFQYRFTFSFLSMADTVFESSPVHCYLSQNMLYATMRGTLVGVVNDLYSGSYSCTVSLEAPSLIISREQHGW